MNIIKIVKCFAVLGLLLGFHSMIGGGFSNANTLQNTISPVTWYVDDDGTADYTSIQNAIDNASDGDTVFVYSGVYTELINVHKSLVLVGEDKNTTIINGAWQGQPVEIWASNVSLRGFNVLNGIDDGYSAGINIYGKHVHVSDCIAQASDCGFRLTFTDDIIVDNCSIRTNSGPSIYLIVSSNVSIRDCDIFRNGDKEGSISGGISISTASECVTQSNIYIRNCKIHDNALCGISIGDAWSELGYKDVYIKNNYIYNNTGTGIVIWKSEVTIRNNIITGNGLDAVVNWDGGIYIQDTIGLVTIEDNQIENNRPKGIYLMRSSGNVIRRNNFIENERHVGFCYNGFNSDCGFSNDWDGNYWDNQINPWVKILFGTFGNKWLSLIPFVAFDFHPAKEPYDTGGNNI